MRKKTVPANVDQIRTMTLEGTILNLSYLQPHWTQLSKEDWKLFVVDQSCGRCHYQRKWITIPIFAIESTRLGYWIWYVSHEFSHAFAGFAAKHGPVFMQTLQRICPVEYQHYELEYKPENASLAGITKEHANKAREVKIIKLEDLL
jgi:hypothetical protein